MQFFDSRGGSNRYTIKTDFFKKWSNEMAYVLGFLYADGDIVDAKSSRTQYIRFSSKDKDILNSIKSILDSKHPIFSRPARLVSHKNGIYQSSESFYIRIGSKRIFADLRDFGLLPNKSKIIKFPCSIPNKHLSHFIRGYFDGDGCVYLKIIKGKKQKFVIKRFNIIFTSGSKRFLQGLNYSIRKFTRINQKKIYYNNRAYQLHYSTSDSIKLFKFLYKNIDKDAYLKRKFKIFLKYFQLRPSEIDKDVKKILKNLEMAWYPSS